MKKLLSILMVLIIAATLSITLTAEEDVFIEIPLTPENLGIGCGLTADQVTWNDVGFTVNDITQISFLLPEPVPMGETVVVHVIGTCDDNFRMWLMESGAATSSNQYNMQSWGFYGGEFDEYIELTATDFDGRGVTEATEFNFKAPTYDTTLTNLTVTYCGIFYGTYDEYEAAAGITEEEDEPKTEPATEPATEPEAEDTQDANTGEDGAGSDTDTEVKDTSKKKGCGSVITANAMLFTTMVAVVGRALIKKKH